MSRADHVLKFVDRAQWGVEIGPSHNPIAAKADGFQVHIIDHASQEDLRTKYKDHNVNLERIEPVDFIWSGQGYHELTGRQSYYGWVIASHVIEHTPDLIKFLNECSGLLTDTGVLSLVVPDKRYCFDHFRGTSNLAQVIDAHFEKRTVHSAGSVADYHLNVVRKGPTISWHPGYPGDYSFVHCLADAQHLIKHVRATNAFIDVHGWCFTPTSFRLLIKDLFDLGFTTLQEQYFSPTEGHEFYMTLSKQPGVALDRMELVKQSLLELTEGL